MPAFRYLPLVLDGLVLIVDDLMARNIGTLAGLWPNERNFTL